MGICSRESKRGVRVGRGARMMFRDMEILVGHLSIPLQNKKTLFNKKTLSQDKSVHKGLIVGDGT